MKAVLSSLWMKIKRPIKFRENWKTFHGSLFKSMMYVAWPTIW